MSVADVSPTSLKTSPSTRRQKKSILSAFLSTKGSHTNSFVIELDDPIKTYGPGDTVKGKVVLDITRPTGVTHVVVSLNGYVQVFKNHARSKYYQPSNVGRPASGRGKRWVSEYYGDGYMSLFEEEIVLCGEGRLDPAYSPFHFHFNLEFPSELALPSSIDFERGTITYVITAKMTRPAYTAPTMTTDARVAFLEDIDLATLSSPKPREVTLHPEHRSGSPRSSLKRFTSYDVKHTHRNSNASTNQPPTPIRTNLESVQSNVDTVSVEAPTASIASTRSSSSGQNRVSAALSEPRSSHTSSSLNGDSRRRKRTIMASAELCRSGALPGQLVSLLVKINHNKIVTNPAGILVTLYRQARVDMHPHLPLASNDKGPGERYEDYYPRSKTGLGGLSLSAAGSSQVWRKDLSQTTAPLYIDPQSMSQEIRVGVRVPELPGTFPSIRNVPGQMISFRYIVEVIIDIHGKLIGHDRVLSSPSASGLAQSPYHLNSPLSSRDGGDGAQSRIYETRCMDTTQLRRDKHAVTMECELVIGTRDSESSKGKQKETRQNSETVSGAQQTLDQVPGPSEPHDALQQSHAYPLSEHNSEYYDHEWLQRWDEYGQRWLYINPWGGIYDDDWNFVGYDDAVFAEQDEQSYPDEYAVVRPPHWAREQEISEKEQLRRAEESLLPSQPPLEGPSASQVSDNIPTAPAIPEEELLYSNHVGPPAPHLERLSSAIHDFASGSSLDASWEPGSQNVQSEEHVGIQAAEEPSGATAGNQYGSAGQDTVQSTLNSASKDVSGINSHEEPAETSQAMENGVAEPGVVGETEQHAQNEDMQNGR